MKVFQKRYVNMYLMKGKMFMKNLTQQEMAVLKYVAQGLSNVEIGTRLNISRHTVKAHVSKIVEKMEARDRVNAAYIAGRYGLI